MTEKPASNDALTEAMAPVARRHIEMMFDAMFETMVDAIEKAARDYMRLRAEISAAAAQEIAQDLRTRKNEITMTAAGRLILGGDPAKSPAVLADYTANHLQGLVEPD